MPCRHDISLLVRCPHCKMERDELEASWKRRALAAEAQLAEIRRLLERG